MIWKYSLNDRLQELYSGIKYETMVGTMMFLQSWNLEKANFTSSFLTKTFRSKVLM